VGISPGLILLIVVLGAVQLAAGVIIGRCWPRADRRGERSAEEARLERLARQLVVLAGAVHDDVDQHQARLREVDDELRTLGPGEDRQLTTIVLKTVGRVLQLNDRLQHRLSDAEKELRLQSQQLQTQATAALTDPLTGLPNRRAFDNELRLRVDQWRSDRRAFCLLAVDVDHFKSLNDRFGHALGDRALCRLGEVLREAVGAWGQVSRIGGEELTVLLACSHLEDAKHVTEKARHAVAAATIDEGMPELRMTVSAGLAMIQAGETGTELCKRADQALYTAKRSGRNCAYWHDGRNCQRVPDGAGATPSDTEELTALCQDLRTRLSQVTTADGEG